MKILVVGRGWTGRKMVSALSKFGGCVTALCSHEYAESEIADGRYRWVVNCAGITGTPNVDACESMKKETIEANALFPIKLYDACVSSGSRFAHFSSGCIYQGTIDNVYDDPNYFGSVYSVSKGVSDVYLKDKAAVFRIRMPFTGVDEPKNYLTKVKNYAKTGKLVNLGQNSMTDLDEAVNKACELILSGSAFGPYNLVNQGSVDMKELASMMGLQNVKWYTPDEFKTATAAARSTCVIPEYNTMRPLKDALLDAIASMMRH